MLLFWPVVIPFATAVLAMLAWRSIRLQRVISLAGGFALLAVAIRITMEVARHGPFAAQAGGWPAPFGITMVADWLAAAMVLITGIIAVATLVYGLSDVTGDEEHHGHHPLTHALLAGICGAFLTGDIFNMYVWFEVMLISSFGLMVVGGSRAQIDGAMKYVGLNLIATVTFLAGVGLLYGATGTLNMADLHIALQGRASEVPVIASAAFLLFAFGAKAALFPVFFWLPASYHTLSFTTSALFSGMLTKVGVYALLRVFTLVFDPGMEAIQTVLLWGAAITMVVGVLGAAAQMDVRRILSFHIISQIGYMVLGLAIHTPLALLGAVFYVIHHIIVKANLFLIAGIMHRYTGSEDLNHIGGLWKHRPWLGVLFLIPAMSLAGMPPLSGFWAKLLLLSASLQEERYVIAFLVLLVGLLTLFSMSKIWQFAFWKPHPRGGAALKGGVPLSALVPTIGLAALTIFIGLYAEPFVRVAAAAADQLMEPRAYIAAVLPEAP